MATADTAAAEQPPRSQLQQVIENIRALDQRQKLAGGVALALAIALVVGALLWQREPDYAVLFSNFDQRDGGAIVTALQQQNVPYRLSATGNAILVPTEQVHDIRLRLAAEGLPKGGLVGFEIMETQKLGVSQFHEQVNYQRALEGELARTIQAIASVASARVHLAMPKQTAFLRDDQKPTASVMVNLRPGRILDGAQVAGIVHLVSSSVPRMPESAVSIVDQNGNLLTKKPDAIERPGLDPNQLRYVQEVEDTYIRRIETILEPLVGRGNYRAQVTADIDFNQVEQTAETYKPNPTPDQAIRSQQISESHERNAGPQGVPGALTNQPPVPATAPITAPPVDGNGANAINPVNSNRNAVINYELDRTIQHVRQSLGQIKRLSVAVVVNHRTETNAEGQTVTVPLSQEEIDKITRLVREAMGYSTERGDSLNVAAGNFAPPAVEPEVPLWKDPAVVGLGMEAGRYLVILLALLFAYFAIVRPLLRTVMPPKEEPEEETEEEDVEVSLSEAAVAGETYEMRLERARQLARDDPKIVAGLIKEWMGVNEEGRK